MKEQRICCRLDCLEFVDYSEFQENHRDDVQEPYEDEGMFVVPEGDGWARNIRPAQLILHASGADETVAIHVENEVTKHWGGVSRNQAKAMAETQPERITIILNPYSGMHIESRELQRWVERAQNALL